MMMILFGGFNETVSGLYDSILRYSLFGFPNYTTGKPGHNWVVLSSNANCKKMSRMTTQYYSHSIDRVPICRVPYDSILRAFPHWLPVSITRYSPAICQAHYGYTLHTCSTICRSGQETIVQRRKVFHYTLLCTSFALVVLWSLWVMLRPKTDDTTVGICPLFFQLPEWRSFMILLSFLLVLLLVSSLSLIRFHASVQTVQKETRCQLTEFLSRENDIRYNWVGVEFVARCSFNARYIVLGSDNFMDQTEIQVYPFYWNHHIIMDSMDNHRTTNSQVSEA